MPRSTPSIRLNRPGGAAPPRVEATAQVELFPLRLVLGEPAALWPDQRGPWRLGCPEGCHPERPVIRALAAAGLAASVLHSTSWRHQAGRLVLTYVAVLRPGAATPGGFTVRPHRRQKMAFGSPTRAPERVTPDQVLEHALRHLAWVAGHDAAIRDALDAAWLRTLAGYRGEHPGLGGQVGAPVSMTDGHVAD